MSKTYKNNNILIIAGWYHPIIGGYIKVIHELAQKLVKVGYNVDILSSNFETDIQLGTIEGINVYKIPSINFIIDLYPIPKINLRNLRFLFTLFRDKKYRCTITNTRFVPICLLGALFSFLFKTPYIHVEHGSCHTVMDNSIISIISKIFDHTFGTILIKSAKINVGVSKAAVNFLIHLGANNPYLIHNSIDFAKYSKKRYHGRNKQIVIAYVGRIIFGKGIQDLISICPFLIGNIKLLIIGDGPYKKKLEDFSIYQTNSNIKFCGAIMPDKIPEMLQNIDIFVNPSYSEGFPTSVLEACAAGCAIIASNVGGTNEIIHDGFTGFLFQPSDKRELTEKLNLLINNANIRNEIGINAQNYVRDNFSWDKSLNIWISIIKRIQE